MDELQAKDVLVSLLESIKDDWYLPKHLIGSIGCDEEIGLDALSTLETEGRVEIYEFEDDVRVRLRPTGPSLSSYQQDYVSRYVPLAKRISAFYAKKYPYLSEELRSVSLFALAKLGLKVEEPMSDVDQKRFVAYARTTIVGEMRAVIREGKHLRGYKAGYTPEILSLEGDEAMGEEIYELAMSDPSLDAQEEIAYMLNTLPIEYQQVLTLMDMRGMTTLECSAVIGCHAFHRRKLALQRLRERYSYETGSVMDKDQQKTPPPESRLPIPRFFLGWDVPIKPRKKQSQFCHACQGRELKTDEYCLSCDRWGMDFMLKVLVGRKTHQNETFNQKPPPSKVKPDEKISHRGKKYHYPKRAS